MMNNNKEIPEAVLKFAKKNDFDYVEYLGKWLTFDIYNPRVNEENAMGGPTPFILYKFGIAIWCTRRQRRIIMDKFYDH